MAPHAAKIEQKLTERQQNEPHVKRGTTPLHTAPRTLDHNTLHHTTTKKGSRHDGARGSGACLPGQGGAVLVTAARKVRELPKRQEPFWLHHDMRKVNGST